MHSANCLHMMKYIRLRMKFIDCTQFFFLFFLLLHRILCILLIFMFRTRANRQAKSTTNREFEIQQARACVQIARSVRFVECHAATTKPICIKMRMLCAVNSVSTNWQREQPQPHGLYSVHRPFYEASNILYSYPFKNINQTAIHYNDVFLFHFPSLLCIFFPF